MPEAELPSPSSQAPPTELYCKAPWAAQSLTGAVVPPHPLSVAARRVEEPKESVRRVTLRIATQPTLGGELPPTDLTAETMLKAFQSPSARSHYCLRVPLSSFYTEEVVSIVTYKFPLPLVTFVR